MDIDYVDIVYYLDELEYDDESCEKKEDATHFKFVVWDWSSETKRSYPIFSPMLCSEDDSDAVCPCYAVSDKGDLYVLDQKTYEIERVWTVDEFVKYNHRWIDENDFWHDQYFPAENLEQSFVDAWNDGLFLEDWCDPEPEKFKTFEEIKEYKEKLDEMPILSDYQKTMNDAIERMLEVYNEVKRFRREEKECKEIYALWNYYNNVLVGNGDDPLKTAILISGVIEDNSSLSYVAVYKSRTQV